jgi:DNA-binding MarR family transcriptional regulator
MTSDEAQAAFGLLEDVLGFRMQRLRAALSAPMLVGMRRWGMRRGAFMVLALVKANPGLSQTALVRETGIQKTLLVALLHELEERGLVVRRALESDRRHNQLFLTDAGEIAVNEMAEIVARIEAPIRRALSPAKIAQLKEALDCALAAVQDDR